jgi:DNA-3-methyladenine glycosylase
MTRDVSFNLQLDATGMKRSAETHASDQNTSVKRQALPSLSTRWNASDFDVPCQDLAVNLLGQTLVRKLDDGCELRCRIVETESYLGAVDKACHTFGGRRTERNKPMYMKPGTSYVYFTYGMYHCFNISSQGLHFFVIKTSKTISILLIAEEGSAVLLRAAEPLECDLTMQLHRKAHQKSKTSDKSYKSHELCNGPSKLCMSLAIDRFSCNSQDLAHWPGMWIERAPAPPEKVVLSTRIGIDSVEAEWRLKPLRFYLLGSKSVSRRDKTEEAKLVS